MSIWSENRGAGLHIMNIHHPDIQRDYRKRCFEVSGRYDIPLGDRDRAQWELEEAMLHWSECPPEDRMWLRFMVLGIMAWMKGQEQKV